MIVLLIPILVIAAACVVTAAVVIGIAHDVRSIVDLMFAEVTVIESGGGDGPDDDDGEPVPGTVESVVVPMRRVG